MLDAIRPTEDLCADLEAYDDRRQIEALAEIRAVLVDVLAARETRLSPCTPRYVLEAFDRVVSDCTPCQLTP